MTHKVCLFLLSVLLVLTAASYRVQALASFQVTSGVEGNWQGALEVSGFKLRLVLKISKTADGKLKATVDSLDQSAKDLVVDTITFQDNTLQFEMKALHASYVGTLSKDGTQLTGQFTQGGVLPLDFKRVTDMSQLELKRPQTPKKPYSYTEAEVSYENKQDQVKLAATLTLPPGAGPFPAVVLITGSGPQDRNEALLSHQPFLVLADYLTRRGIAVLRADDRGVGGTSRGGPNDTTENFADDALAGVDFEHRSAGAPSPLDDRALRGPCRHPTRANNLHARLH